MENELKKDTKKFFSKLGLMYMIGSIIIFAVQLTIPKLIFNILPNLVVDYDEYFMLVMLPVYLIGMPILILLLKTIPVTTVNEKK